MVVVGSYSHMCHMYCNFCAYRLMRSLGLENVSNIPPEVITIFLAPFQPGVHGAFSASTFDIFPPEPHQRHTSLLRDQCGSSWSEVAATINLQKSPQTSPSSESSKRSWQQYAGSMTCPLKCVDNLKTGDLKNSKKINLLLTLKVQIGAVSEKFSSQFHWKMLQLTYLHILL